MSKPTDMLGEAAEDAEFRRLFAEEWARDCAQMNLETPDLPAPTQFQWERRADGWHWVASPSVTNTAGGAS